jgi:hypothetical protein
VAKVTKKAVKKVAKKAPSKKAVKEYVSDKVFDGKKPITGKRLELLKEKTDKKKASKETFTVTTFTERGARSLKRIYEGAGYKFVKSEITPDQVFLTFENKE